MHGFVWNELKKAYTDKMLPRVTDLPKFKRIELEYFLYTGSHHKTDVMNWVSVIDKFFQDVLVQANKLDDDNTDYVPVVTGRFIGIDKSNPRMEIIIKELP